jgi:DNA-binding CsgD family transcriptional regulator/PAS domain-containing protein
MESELLAVIEMFYQAATEPDAWPAALGGITRLLRADHTHLVIEPKSDGFAPLLSQFGMDHADFRRCVSPQADRLQMALVAAALPTLRPGGSLVQGEVVSDRDYERSRFYNEIIRPIGTYYGAAITHDGSDLSLRMCAVRTRRSGEFLRPEGDLLEQLFPHLIRAYAMHQRLRIESDRAAGLAAVVERLNEAAIVLDARGHPLVVNARAREILRRANGLSEAAGVLQASTPALTERLRHAITIVGRSAADHGQRLHLPRRDRLPLLLDIMPVWRLGLPEPGLRAPRVVIFIGEPDAPPRFDETALMDTFRLTRRECDVVCLLAEGRSVGAIATRLGIQVGTVRQNLKSAFEKTHVHSQAALVALVLGFAR